MKLSETVMTTVIVILSLLPFVWFTYIGKKASIKNKKAIKDLLKKESFNFNQKEFWNQNFIGIDEAKNQLLFIKIKPTENEVVNIDLNDVKSCQIHKNTKDIKTEKKLESELQTMELELAFNSKRPNVILNFYDIRDHLAEEFELNRADKWRELITNGIQKNVTTSKAA